MMLGKKNVKLLDKIFDKKTKSKAWLLLTIGAAVITAIDNIKDIIKNK